MTENFIQELNTLKEEIETQDELNKESMLKLIELMKRRAEEEEMNKEEEQKKLTQRIDSYISNKYSEYCKSLRNDISEQCSQLQQILSTQPTSTLESQNTKDNNIY